MMGIQWIYTLYTTQIHVAKMKQSVFYKTSLDLTLRYKIDVWKYFDKINTMNVQSELQVKRWTICAQSQCCQIYQNIDSEYLMLCKYSFSAVSIHQYKRQRQLTQTHTTMLCLHPALYIKTQCVYPWCQTRFECISFLTKHLQSSFFTITTTLSTRSSSWDG